MTSLIFDCIPSLKFFNEKKSSRAVYKRKQELNKKSAKVGLKKECPSPKILTSYKKLDLKKEGAHPAKKIILIKSAERKRIVPFFSEGFCWRSIRKARYKNKIPVSNRKAQVPP